MAGVAVYYAKGVEYTQHDGSKKRPVICILIAFSQDSLSYQFSVLANSFIFRVFTKGTMYKSMIRDVSANSQGLARPDLLIDGVLEALP